MINVDDISVLLIYEENEHVDYKCPCFEFTISTLGDLNIINEYKKYLGNLFNIDYNIIDHHCYFWGELLLSIPFYDSKNFQSAKITLKVMYG